MPGQRLYFGLQHKYGRAETMSLNPDDFVDETSLTVNNDIVCPVNAFPEKLQKVIKHYADIKGYPIDYLFTGVLAAIGTAIGNSHILHTVNGYKAKANLFVAIIGRRGFNKTEALIDAFKPIENHLQVLHTKYINEMKTYKAIPKKERENLLPPFFGKPILSDATPEAVALQLYYYLKGSTIVVDELAGFIKSFERYAKGADEQFYLSAWSGTAITKDRVTSESLFIRFPFLGIAGTIQPEVADQVFYGKVDSGFFDRWLLCYPSKITKPYPSPRNFDPEIVGQYEYMINCLLKFDVGIDSQPTKLFYSPEAWEVVYKWICHNTDIENLEDTTPIEGGIRAKMDIYLHRFALIIQLALYACGETTEREKISQEAAESAVKIANYFFAMAEKKRIKDKSELLPPKWLEVYKLLPKDGDFTSIVFFEIIKLRGLSESTAEKWLRTNTGKNGKLFEKVKHGVYRKL